MRTQQNRSNLHTALSKSQVSSNPVVNVISFDLAGNGLARVTCSVNHAGDSRENPTSIAKELKGRFGGKLEAVAGSFTSLEKGEFQEQITGVVSVVREAMPANKENLKGFKSISANMFMDEEENMWVVRKSAAGDLVVKTTGIDDDMSLVKLLNQACSSTTSLSSVSDHRRMVAHASAVCESVTGGDFVSYVTASNTIGYGFVVATAETEEQPEVKQAVVMPVGIGDEEVINTKAITEIHDQEDFPVVELSQQELVDAAVSTSRGESGLQVLLDYYKKVYARSPEFYKQFAARLKSHAFL